jgi:hypothetical protein
VRLKQKWSKTMRDTKTNTQNLLSTISQMSKKELIEHARKTELMNYYTVTELHNTKKVNLLAMLRNTLKGE